MKAFWRFFERSVFVTMILVVASLTACCVAPISDYIRTMPLFDEHNHLQYDESAVMLIKWMDEAGVRRRSVIIRIHNMAGSSWSI